VRGTVNELALDTVKVGDTITGTSYETGSSFTAEIVEISEYPDESANSFYGGYGEENTNSSYYPFLAYIEDAEGLEVDSYVDLSLSENGFTDSGDPEMSNGLCLEEFFIRKDNSGRSYCYVLGKDGLLEKLTRWVFVEWSEANNLVQDVSYPSNMLYSMMLDVASRLYNDPALAEQAAQMREQIRKQSFDGEYFIDNAKRGKGGRLELTGKHTEACQYYAFFTGVATPELYPALWSRLRDEFGPERKKTNAYEDVPFANAFIGNYLRMELLSREGLSKQILDETIDFYHPMAEQTGTLWENMTTVASCNHGFASHIIRVLNRDVLGIYDISTADKKVTLRFADCGLTTCRGSIPVGDEAVTLEWTMVDGKLSGMISLPEGYTFECLDSDLDITINIQK
jgi:hypothetical protein